MQEQIAEPAAVNVVVGENTRGQRQTLPGQAPTFDLMRDCMPSHLDSTTHQCLTPTMLRFTDVGATSVDLAIMRNRFQDYLMWRSEQQCELHKARIVATQSTANFAFNTVTTATAGVGAIVLAPASNILAALAAISSGTRSHMNEDFYRQYIAPAIIKRINADREKKYSDIMARRAGPTPLVTVVAADGSEAKRRIALLQDYTVEEAIADVERYNQLCSFISGLSSLVDPGEKFEDTAKGIQARIELMREMQTANEAQASALMTSIDKGKLTEPELSNAKESVKRLRDTNADISRQIMILQQRLLAAPLSVNSRPTSG